ncbi:nucleotide exchange factor GrpE [Carnobacterium gallinarum]|uniref:nucleotide exchange factor GrpE n=1 Tax=Carnobacterium gallinarum TaxID=2749 RepID=UPI00055054D0|nr:nucleotide exchange factor GrpE [Carnobacterium gallinarum]
MTKENNNEEVVEELQNETDSQEILENEELVEVDELAETKVALDEMEDRYLRLQAELANMRKRGQKEREDAAKYRSQSLATELLPVIDNLERAMATDIDDAQAEGLKKGLEMVMTTFRTALKNEGIEEINPVNEAFDPNYHQAVQTQPVEEGQASDTIVTVLQKGYVLKDRVLRPAMVIVAQ